jgi:hypothetical protein
MHGNILGERSYFIGSLKLISKTSDQDMLKLSFNTVSLDK